ncbi:MAG: hypothetical protein U0636_12445 [Phycisphaerales bacterium]
MRLRTRSLMRVAPLLLAAPALASGELVWTGGPSGAWEIAANWTPATVPNNLGADVWTAVVNGGSSVSLTSTVLISGLQIGSGSLVTVSQPGNLKFTAGELVNNGTLRVSSVTATSASITVTGQLLVSGTGVIELTGPVTSKLVASPGATTLINSAGHTIRGSGVVSGPLALDNRGIFEATTGLLQCTVEGRSPSATRNTGVLRANGANLSLLGGSVDNSGGVMEAVNGGILSLGLFTIEGGLIRSQPGNQVTWQGSGSMKDLSIQGRLRADTTLSLSGQIFHDDVLSVYASLSFAPGSVLDGPGSVELVGTNPVINANAGATHASISAAHSVRGGGRIQTGALDSYGLIEATDPAKDLRVLSANLTNYGIMQARGGKLRILSSTVTNGSEGRIISKTGNVVEVASNSSLFGGTVECEPGAQVIWDSTVGGTELVGVHSVAAGAKLSISPSITVNGTLNVAGTLGTTTAFGGSSMFGNGTCNLQGGVIAGSSSQPTMFTVGPGLTLAGKGSISPATYMDFKNQGNLRVEGGGDLLFDSAGVFTNSGTLHVTAGNTFTCSKLGPWTTSGSVVVEAGAVFTRSAQFTQTAGTVTVDGTLKLNGATYVQTHGTLLGSGRVEGSFKTTYGTVEGNGLEVTGAYQHAVAGTLKAVLGAAGPGTEPLAVSGAATVRGTLDLVFAPGSEPREGQQFTVLTAGQVIGQFDTVVSDPPVSVEYLAKSVRVTVLAPAFLPADVNQDHSVDEHDVAEVLRNWGLPGPTDINGDGTTDGFDLGVVLGGWRPLGSQNQGNANGGGSSRR